jgi:Cysteine rich repeat
MTPAEKAHLLRSNCGSDFHKFCSGVALGGGRGSECLKAHASDLSASCKSVLMSVAPAH